MSLLLFFSLVNAWIKPPRLFKTEKERWESDWWCTLPPNAEGFHVGEAKTKLVKRLLREKPTRKRKLMNHFLGAVDSRSVKTRI